MIHSFRNLTLESLEGEDEKMEGNELEYLAYYVFPSNKGTQNLFGEWMDSIEHLDAYVTGKPTDMEIDTQGTNYMDEDPMVLMLREKGTRWEPAAIIEATIELKNQAWEGAAHPKKDSSKKIKTVEPITPAKNIISIPIESVSTSINIPIESVCDHSLIESVSVESVKNSFPYKMISDSAYLLDLNIFIFEIGKETLNNKELKQGHVEPIKEETKPVNLRTGDEPKMIHVGNTLTSSEKDALVALLTEFKVVFAWSYEDMPRIDTDIVQHYIPTDLTMKPINPKLRRMKPEWILKIKEEVEKQYNARFLRVVNYPEWLANVVPVPKKDGKVRICVDFQDLNKANPKDDFLLPHIDILVNNTAGLALLSFMDGFSGYNQIKIAPEDMEKTSFIAPQGTYCYKIMPFGLKNAGATYQLAATTLLHDLIHKEVEVYVDDMIVKSKDREGHIPALQKFFERIQFYKLRLNPKKSTFGVTSRKLLGFMVSQRGIEVDPDKIKAIVEMKPHKTETKKEIRGFLERIQYISRFIAQLTMTCEPLFRLLKKEVPTVQNEQCQEAFEKIKNYLIKPPILVPPVPEKPLLAYLTTTNTAMGALLTQYLEETRKENAIYYISKRCWLMKRSIHHLRRHVQHLYGQLANPNIIYLLTRSY